MQQENLQQENNSVENKTDKDGWLWFYKFICFPFIIIEIIYFLITRIIPLIGNILTIGLLDIRFVYEWERFFLPIIIILPIVFLIITIILFVGFLKKKRWAYKLNFKYLFFLMFSYGFLNAFAYNFTDYHVLSSLFLESLFNTIELSKLVLNLFTFLFFVILYGSIWVLPNWIYFKKRKHFFNN